MSPAGSFESLTAAIQGGANSVYFGVEQLNMRARAANNFKLTDLPEIVRQCNEHNVRTYLALNTVLYNHDMVIMKKLCDAVKDAGVTAIIASDISAISYARSIGIEVHISTQQNVSNVEAVKFFAAFADVIVLARELTLKDIQLICTTIEKEQIKGPSGNLVGIELFAHGALCVAISGKCYMSLATQNASANRGACVQNCRRSYRVIDEETGEELVLENEYIMSPKDLCTIKFLDQIIGAGVSVLKLEGRGRSADYVKTVTRCYREAADAVLNGTYTDEKKEAWTKELETVYNRGFWHGGYYLGKKLGEWSGEYGSKSVKEKLMVGVVTNYFQKAGIAEIMLHDNDVSVGQDLLVIGKTTGVVESKVESIYFEEQSVDTGKKGTIVTIPVSTPVRKKDQVFVKIPRIQETK